MEVRLPISKSIAARQLLLQHTTTGQSKSLYQSYLAAQGTALPLDVQLLGEALQSIEAHTTAELRCHESGTALRFLIATIATGTQPHTLSLAPRLAQRPILPLLQFFGQMGATFRQQGTLLHITPITHRTYPPLTNTTHWPSSQFTSALLLTAHRCQWQSLRLKVSPTAPSYSYTLLTRHLIQQWGITTQLQANILTITEAHPTPPSPTLPLEACWSSAAFFYQLLALAPHIGTIVLPHLQLPSAQPDSHLATLYSTLGVATTSGITLHAQPTTHQGTFCTNIAQCPDLFPPLVLTLIGKGIPFQLTGTATLTLKESNRLQALTQGLHSLGYSGLRITPNSYCWNGTAPTHLHHYQGTTICTHNDHRIAMAFATFSHALQLHLHLTHPQAIAKSFPHFPLST